MTKFLLSTFVLFLSFHALAQKKIKPIPYKIGIGGGYYPNLKEPYMASVKFYMKSGNALDFMGYNLQKSVRLTTLFNINGALTKDGRLRAVVGPGVHIGIWKEKYKTNSFTKNPIVGIDGILGLEYRIPKLPISVQAHYQPNVDIAGNNEYNVNSDWCGFALRVVF